MLPVGFEPTISAGERPQSYALDRAATGTEKCEHCTALKMIGACKFVTSDIVAAVLSVA